MEDFVNLVDRQKINYLSSSYLQLSQRYLGEEPTIQGTHNSLRQLKQDPGVSIPRLAHTRQPRIPEM